MNKDMAVGVKSLLKSGLRTSPNCPPLTCEPDKELLNQAIKKEVVEPMMVLCIL